MNKLGEDFRKNKVILPLMFYLLDKIENERKGINKVEFTDVKSDSIIQECYYHAKMISITSKIYKHIILPIFLLFFIIDSHAQVYEFTADSIGKKDIEKQDMFVNNLDYIAYSKLYIRDTVKVCKEGNIYLKSIDDFMSSKVDSFDFVFVDEVHGSPIHQSFMIYLLGSLRKKNKDIIFCAELFPCKNNDVTKLNTLGYSLHEFNDIADPMYYDIYKTAINLKFDTYGYDPLALAKHYTDIDTIESSDTLFYVKHKKVEFTYKVSFDKMGNQKNVWIKGKEKLTQYNESDSNSRINFAVRNLNKLKKLFPSKTIFVFSAGTHGWKIAGTDASLLTKRYNYKILSISQTRLNNDSTILIINDSIVNRKFIQEPKYTYNSDLNSICVVPKDLHKIDVNLIHPSTFFKFNRVNWHNILGLKEPFFCNSIRNFTKNRFPIMIIAYEASEFSLFNDNTIARDIIQLNSINDTIMPLLLYKDKSYILKIIDKNYKLLSTHKIINNKNGFIVSY